MLQLHHAFCFPQTLTNVTSSRHQSFLFPQRHVSSTIMTPLQSLNAMMRPIRQHFHPSSACFLHLLPAIYFPNVQLLLHTFSSPQNRCRVLRSLPLPLLQRQRRNSIGVQQNGRCRFQRHQRQLLPLAAREAMLGGRDGGRQGENTEVFECCRGRVLLEIPAAATAHGSQWIQVVVCDGYPKSAKA